MAPYACIPKIPIAPGKLQRNVELMQPVVKNAKSHETEPGCQAYYFFVPQDGNEDFMYGVEIYDDQKAIKETHFNSNAFQTFAAAGQKEGVNSGPPSISFGNVLGGWLTTPGEPKRTSDQVILFGKFTVVSGKRAEFTKPLIEGLDTIKRTEPGTLSILLIEDDSDPDVCYTMERFKDNQAYEAHMNGEAGKQVLPLIKDLVKSREGGLFKEIAGFLSKDD